MIPPWSSWRLQEMSHKILLKYITFYQNFEISRKWMKNILIYSIHFLKTSRKWKKNLPDASLKFITCMRKCRNFVKNDFLVCKNSHVHLQYIHNNYAWFQNDSLKTVRSWLHKLHTLQFKKLPKKISSKGCNSVKINSSSTKNPHAHLQYVHNRYAWFQQDPFKTVGGVDYTNSKS